MCLDRGNLVQKHAVGKEEKMSRETIKYLIDMIPEKDIDTIYRVLVRFVPETEPLPDEIEAILEAKADTSPTISHNEINWD